MTEQHTFIVLAYKTSPYLEECLQSLMAQSVPSKIIISTATPNSFIENMAKKYKLPIKINRGKKGLAADWNFALRQAKTPYATLAHQDDVYLPEYTEVMLQGLEEQPDFSIKFCDYQEIYHSIDSQRIRTWTLNFIIKRLLVLFNYFGRTALISPQAKLRFLGFGSPISCPSVLYHVKKLQKFSFDEGFQINVDWTAWINLALNFGPFLKTGKILMQHRIHAGSATTMGLRQNVRQNEDLLCFAKLWPANLVKPLSKLYSISYWTNG